MSTAGDVPDTPQAEIAKTDWYAYIEGTELPSIVAVLQVRPGETGGHEHLPQVAFGGIFPEYDAFGSYGSSSNDRYMRFIDTMCSLSVADFERLKSEGRLVLLRSAETGTAE